MLYMVVERFKNGADPVYERFRKSGRMLPDGLQYIESWVDTDLTKCFQLMECSDTALLESWMEKWEDLVDFEFYEVMSSKSAQSTTARDALNLNA